MPGDQEHRRRRLRRVMQRRVRAQRRAAGVVERRQPEQAPRQRSRVGRVAGHGFEVVDAVERHDASQARLARGQVRDQLTAGRFADQHDARRDPGAVRARASRSQASAAFTSATCSRLVTVGRQAIVDRHPREPLRRGQRQHRRDVGDTIAGLPAAAVHEHARRRADRHRRASTDPATACWRRRTRHACAGQSPTRRHAPAAARCRRASTATAAARACSPTATATSSRRDDSRRAPRRRHTGLARACTTPRLGDRHVGVGKAVHDARRHRRGGRVRRSARQRRRRPPAWPARRRNARGAVPAVAPRRAGPRAPPVLRDQHRPCTGRRAAPRHDTSSAGAAPRSGRRPTPSRLCER